MISLETIMEEVSSLGPDWTFLLRSTNPAEDKPGKFLVNISWNRTRFSNQGHHFPVYGDEIGATFEESLRRARAFLSEGVR